MQLKPGGENDARLLSNRALALHKAGRHSAAAEDAARACSLAPEWGKAWFRLGTARGSLGDAPGAVAAFTRGLRVQPGCCELRAALRAAVWRMTREQLAATLLRALDEAQERGCLVPPEVEDVTRAEKEEALFRHIHLFQRDKPKPGDYYAYLTLWSEAEWSAGACSHSRQGTVLLCLTPSLQAWHTSTALGCTHSPSATRRQQRMRRRPSSTFSPARVR
jgi:tetratricopeptide (TPR) repeat protein